MTMHADKILKIEGDECGRRVVANLFKVGDRYIFLDIGWPFASSNPYHWIGKMISEKKDEWIFQDDTYAAEEPEPRTFKITPIEKDDPLMKEAMGWKEFVKGKQINTEEQGKKSIREEFKIPTNVDIQ